MARSEIAFICSLNLQVIYQDSLPVNSDADKTLA